MICTALPLDEPLIDHIAISRHFAVSEVEVIPDHDPIGNLSDHRGVIGMLSRTLP
jgi:endonuclease/exonuclease/phosphatase family metal-dependent hydrolase